jgi:hypothetical protein
MAPDGWKVRKQFITCSAIREMILPEYFKYPNPTIPRNHRMSNHPENHLHPVPKRITIYTQYPINPFWVLGVNFLKGGYWVLGVNLSMVVNCIL